MNQKSPVHLLVSSLAILFTFAFGRLEATTPTAPPWGSNYQMVFCQDYTAMTSLTQLNAVGGYTLGTGTWISHTPSHSDWFTFIDPVDNNDPFGIGSGYLDIRASIRGYGDPNNWFSGYSGGLLSSCDQSGTGFAQKYGYFECSMQTPGGPNTWPAFWLLDQPSLASPSSYSYGAEIDVTESYGNWGTGPNQSPAGNPNYSSTTWHRWALTSGGTSTSGSSYTNQPGMTTGYHTYGVDIEPTTTTWYFDRVQVWQTTTIDAAQRPMFLLLNLALGGGNYNNATNTGYNWTLTPNPSDLKVQYVAVWASPNSPNYTTSGGSGSSIGVDFYDSASGGTYSPGNQTLTATDSVGASASTGWYNNIDVASTCPTNVVLKDNTNTSTTATLTVKPSGTALDGKSVSFFTPWNGTANTSSNTLTAEQRLFNGDLGTANNNGYAQEISLASIPYSNYDVYVYLLTSPYTSASAQVYTGGVAGAIYYLGKGVAWAPGDHLPTTYTQATATSTPGTYGANYIKFSNLSGAAQTIDVVSSTETGLGGSIGIVGVQVVNHTTAIVGVNFYDSATGGTNSPGNQTLATTDVVGASASAGWYNSIDVASTCPTNVVLKDSTGANTTATLSVTPSGTVLDGKATSFYTPWNGTANTTTAAASLTAEQRLFNGNIGTSNNNGYATQIVLQSIPYSSYDVYIYPLTSVYTSGSAQIFVGGVAGGAGTTYYFAKAAAWAPGDHLPTTYTQATATALPSTYGANYVKFSGLSGTAQTFDIVSSTETGLGGAIGICGVEIVPH
jgi:beta-glucanase (GH16 family)